MTVPQPASASNVGLDSSRFFFLSSQASPCLSSGVFLVFCPLELECAGNHLVVCLRTADASSFKMNY